MLVADTDVPGPNSILFEIRGPDGRTQQQSSSFERAEDLPRELALVYTRGALGPFTVSASLTTHGQTLSITHRVSFVRGRTLSVPLTLASACLSRATCPEQCSDRGCVDTALGPEDLTPYAGAPHRVFGADAGAAGGGAPGDGGPLGGDGGPLGGGDAATPLDAGQTACEADGVDLSTDPAHCGACDHACEVPANLHASGATCDDGVCGLLCEQDWGDCDRSVDNGCEEHLLQNDQHCGACDNRCRGNRTCDDHGQCVR
jgi:hypothetical protein